MNQPFPDALAHDSDYSGHNRGNEHQLSRWAVHSFDAVKGVGRRLFAVALVAFCVWPEAVSAATEPARESLAQAQAKLQTPPAWFATTSIQWDTNKPWKDARLEIRRLMGLDAAANRQAVKLTWLYGQKGDIGDGHEWPMYLFMTGNYAWAAREYPAYLAKMRGNGPTHAYECFASCLAHFSEYPKALEILNQAMEDLPPKPWRIANTASVHNHLGDLYAKMGDLDQAKAHYAEAIRLYPTSDQPYGRHLLVRHAAKAQAKLDLLTRKNLDLSKLRDGSFTGKSLGYAEKPELEVRLTLRGGRITDLKVQHGEKIELNATTLIPERIQAQQNLEVDGVTGATVTSQAIVHGAYQALKQAGLN